MCDTFLGYRSRPYVWIKPFTMAKKAAKKATKKATKKAAPKKAAKKAAKKKK